MSKLCPLCNRNDETVEHFLLRCGELHSVRKPFVRQIVLLLESTMNTTTRVWEGDDMVQLILDPTTLLSWCGTEDDSALDQLFSVARSLCYALHVRRSALLETPNR